MAKAKGIRGRRTTEPVVNIVAQMIAHVRANPIPVVCSFGELNASVRALNAQLAAQVQRKKFDAARKQFLAEIRALKAAYQAYWDAAFADEDVRDDLRGQFNLLVHTTDGALRRFLRATIGITKVKRDTAEFPLVKRVQEAISNLYTAINAPQGKP